MERKCAYARNQCIPIDERNAPNGLSRSTTADFDWLATGPESSDRGANLFSLLIDLFSLSRGVFKLVRVRHLPLAPSTLAIESCNHCNSESRLQSADAPRMCFSSSVHGKTSSCVLVLRSSMPNLSLLKILSNDARIEQGRMLVFRVTSNLYLTSVSVTGVLSKRHLLFRQEIYSVISFVILKQRSPKSCTSPDEEIVAVTATFAVPTRV